MTAGARDPGLAAQRTGLAWGRTIISAAPVAALCSRGVIRGGRQPATVVALVLLVPAVVIVLVVGLGARYASGRGEGPVGRRALQAAAAACTALAAAAVVLSL